MPLFISEEELRLCSGDAGAVAERADSFIRDLYRQLDTVRAEADASSIAAEQTAALLEQRYTAISADLSRLQAENAQLSASAEQHLVELAEARAEKHQLHLKAIGKDGEIERLSTESAETHKAKRQLLELLEQKNTEIQEKNAMIQSYLNKIVSLTDNATSKDATLHELQAELARCHAACNRGVQEKELLEKHNAWLNEELTAKVNTLLELRRKHNDLEAEMSVKLDELERQANESSTALKRSKERAGELDSRVASLEEELCSSKDAAAANEARFAAELSTVTKLVELYKESSEEWSKKAGELEGVIKALETHLAQVENDYKERLEKETLIRQNLEKEAMDLKEKLGNCEAEIEKTRKTNELSLVPISGFHADSNLEELGETGSNDILENFNMPVPKLPRGISGTALAASLLREGWSLAKMFEKYQEAADALRHEKWGRKHSEAILERVLHEIEEKAELILDERAEHERLVEAYTLLDQKLQLALSEHDTFEDTIRRLKAELKRSERENTFAQKEIADLQKQVTILLKECQDIQLRCGGASQIATNTCNLNASLAGNVDGLDTEYAISERLTFKDINGLVEQNVKLRSLVRSLSSGDETRDAELREAFQIELRKVTDEASSKVEAVLKRSEEQGGMIESLHCSVAMYKRLYEEERKNRASTHSNDDTLPGDGKDEPMPLFDISRDASKKAYEQLTERAKSLEQDLERLRSELRSLRSERDKFLLEADFARERLDSFKKEYEILRGDANAVSARNIELSRLVIDYQKKLRENSDSYQESMESSRKLSMEVSILKHERDILIQTEKRASDEVRSLSERVHRLQSSLDTVQTAEEVREIARAAERRKDEENLKRAEREWAEAKKELQEERDRVRSLALDREKIIENSAIQVEEMRKELADAWHAVASAESRAAVAEARFSDLEAKISISGTKVIRKDVDQDHSVCPITEDTGDLSKMKEEMEKLKEEAHANKDYMLQYKGIAQTSEAVSKQIESDHEEYKAEAEKTKKVLQAEILSLRNRISELESNFILKSEEAASATQAKESALSSALVEISSLRDEISGKITQVTTMEMQVSSLKDDLEKEHRRWRIAQDNYERQVILQSETIQELTNTSREVSSLQCEIAKERQLSDMLKTENDALKTSWEKDKSELQELKDESERKYNELNEQNKILHTRLESLHIRLADRERYSAGSASQNSDSQESDLQTVVSYLRRSKEIAETEISLLKQEKFRLQSQLESALKASETAQSLLHSQRENSKAILFKDDEFKSLQLQVREISLLRESNIQLREENKHNFEECQKFQEEARAAKWEIEKIVKVLKEKEIEHDASKKEMEMQKLEIESLKNRIAELLENSKNIDAEEYERMRKEIQQNKVLMSEKEDEIQLARSQLLGSQAKIFELEQTLAKCQLELAEQERKLNDALQVEANTKKEKERQQRINTLLKRKNESLASEKEELHKEKQALLKQIDELKLTIQKKSESFTKEKEEFNKEKQTLLKQIEDTKLGRRSAGENSSDKEKDTRIQILEKTLEREREERKKERDDMRKLKLKRQKSQNSVLGYMETVEKEKKKFEEELAKHKNAIGNVLETRTLTSSQLPSSIPLDEQTSAYFLSVDNMEEAANLFLNEDSGKLSTPAVTSIVDTSPAAAGRQGPIQQLRPITPQAIIADETDKGATAPKPNTETRRVGRRLVRPRLEQPGEPAAETEMSTMEGTTTTVGKATSHEPEHSGDISIMHPIFPGRKRRAPSPLSELREDTVAQDDVNYNVGPSLKKSRDTELGQDVAERQSIPSSSENPDISQLPSSDNFDAQPPIANLETEHEDVSYMAKEDNINIKEEIGDQLKGAQDGTNQDEVQYEGDAMLEDVSDKPRAVVEFFDESPKGEDGNEIMQSPVEVDEREEGELMPDESGNKEEDASPEGQHELVSGDEIGTSNETRDAVEAFVPDALNEKGENADVIEEAAEGSGNKDDHGITDTTQSSQTSLAAQEGSPDTFPHNALPEGQINTFTDMEETRSVTRVVRDTAEQGRPVRKAQQSPSTRGRGRAASVYRRDGNRGRGGRGARGQGSTDREQA